MYIYWTNKKQEKKRGNVLLLLLLINLFFFVCFFAKYNSLSNAGSLMAGDRSDDTAHTFNVHPSLIYCLQERFIVTGVTSNRPRNGRPRVTME